MAWARHMRVTFGGNLSDLGTMATEIWQCNVNINPTSLNDAFCDPYLAAIQAALKTWFITAANQISSAADLRYIKCNLIGVDGLYENPTVTHRYDYTSIGAGGSTPTIPGDMCLAYSWSTALMRGPGSKGRIYPPNAPTTAAAGSMIASGSSISAAVTSAKALLTVLASSSTTAAVPVIASGVNASLTPITGVRVGNLFDVQRRRRNAAPEIYSASVWP